MIQMASNLLVENAQNLIEFDDDLYMSEGCDEDCLTLFSISFSHEISYESDESDDIIDPTRPFNPPRLLDSSLSFSDAFSETESVQIVSSTTPKSSWFKLKTVFLEAEEQVKKQSLEFKCKKNKCNETFENIIEAQEHYSQCHQKKLVISIPNGKSPIRITLDRRKDGYFCCICDHRHKSPSILRTHILSNSDCIHRFSSRLSTRSTSGSTPVKIEKTNGYRVSHVHVKKEKSDSPDSKVSIKSESLPTPTKSRTTRVCSEVIEILSVVAHGDQIIQAPVLARYGLVVNRILSLVLCTHCVTSLVPDVRVLANHFWWHHNGVLRIDKQDYPTIEKLFLSTCNLISPFDPFSRSTPSLSTPIQGLPYDEGFQCLVCQSRGQIFCTVSKNKMILHIRHDHKGTPIENEPWSSCFVQTVSESRLKYFPISSPPRETVVTVQRAVSI